ncbi:hypothetical protein BABINDRAFT_162098 [Babjeviella inositovora NRRL Y-12698]|uniref:Lysyl-tRNA synthetase n=1 Tax=Babjeviella inositovora NRRL Y-12698 TaxID=984486 RepID=A0A1E3QMW1_9ASCO|nr:uncharacterized protein BABINDRAFT_162098 [Babjeviella inositovora NRRL Y-12698]ODQ79029.1 hypothetical protein BABINDRAFT_162098 [Babjeviella inositovora NRRL Y-12698]
MLPLLNRTARPSRLISCPRLNSTQAITHEEREVLEFANRKNLIKANPKDFYPTLSEARFNDAIHLRVPEFIEQFQKYEFPPENRLSKYYTVEGKIQNIRKAGKAMYFIDVVQDFHKVQLVATNSMMKMSKEAFAEAHETLKKGDIITCKGFPGTTKVGELSVKLTEAIRLAVPALHPLPPKLNDRSKIRLNRVVDYLVNAKSRERMIVKSILLTSIRRFFNEREFLEVQTPIIGNSSKGANATPFTTSSQHLKDVTEKPIELHLRVAPELWLKRLVIGGFEKVYEIGQVFRNEGIDRTHNPEFTSCEFYQSFTTLEELMGITEQLFLYIAKDLLSTNLKVTDGLKARAQVLVDNLTTNSGVFARLEFIPALERTTGHPFPAVLSQESLLAYYATIGLKKPSLNPSPIQLLDELSATYLEPLCKEYPTFIYHQPAIMSPLAKSTEIAYGEKRYEISRRFEMYIHGKEYVNAYEEQNSPFQQLENFMHQQESKDQYLDDEMLVPDHKYVEAMEWGLPPTGGWGLGVDRLVMFLTKSDRIEEVLSFGDLSDVTKQ